MTLPVATVPSAPVPPTPPEAERGAFAATLGTIATVAPDRPIPSVSTFSLSAWAVARYTLVVALVLGAISLAEKIQEVFLLMFLAILFATAIEPIVNRLRRGPFSRGQGILIVYTVIFAVLGTLIVLFAPGLIAQAGEFADSLPQRVAALRPQLEQLQPHFLQQAAIKLVDQIQPSVQQTLAAPVATDQPEQIVAAGGAFAHSLFSVVTVFLLAFYWLTERATIKRGLLRLVPNSRAKQVNDVWLDVEARLGGWVRGQLIVMLALGIMTGLTAWALGLPNPVLLGVLAGVLEIIPLIGPFLAFIPALLVALAVDPSKVLFLIPAAIVIQQIEGNVLIPRIMSHSVGVSPLTVILGILVGGLVYGPAGAFIAVPVAAAIQVILSELHPTMEDAPAPELLSAQRTT